VPEAHTPAAPVGAWLTIGEQDQLVPVRENQRLEQWRELLASAFCGLQPEQIDVPLTSPWSLRGPDGELSCASLGRAGAFRVTGSPQIVRRTPRSIAQAPADPLKVCIQQTGRAVVHQSGRELVIGPNELALYDTGRPYDLRLEGDWTCAVMTLPREALDAPEHVISAAMQHPFRVDGGAGAVLSHLLDSVWDEPLDAGAEIATQRLGEAALQLLACLVSADVSDPGLGRPEVLRSRVHEFVRTNLAEPGLTQASVAAAHHISVRTLQRLFAQEPRSVADVIRSQRLAAIHDELLDPRSDRRSVMAVASRWGYTEPSHFTRAFRGLYGVTPAALRKAHRAVHESTANHSRRWGGTAP